MKLEDTLMLLALVAAQTASATTFTVSAPPTAAPIPCVPRSKTPGMETRSGSPCRRNATAIIANCTLSGNSSLRFGGGICNNPGGTMTIRNCTLNNNSASHDNGGGIDNSGVLTVANSTLSGNSAGQIGGSGGGGAISNERGTLTVINCTLTGNTAYGCCNQNPGGIYNQSGTVTVGSTILNNTGQPPNIYNAPFFSPGTISSLGFNLKNAFDLVLTNATDRLGGPMLGPLQDNGGPTFTHAPLSGSPVIDAGKNFSGSATDQRGFVRTYDAAAVVNATGGDGTDIGAVEDQPAMVMAAAVLLAPEARAADSEFSAPTSDAESFAREVTGHGTWALNTNPDYDNHQPYIESTSISAWLDPNGTPHGTIVWMDTYNGPDDQHGRGFSGYTWQVEVDTFIAFLAHEVYVEGVITQSNVKSDIGGRNGFAIRDNDDSASEQINGFPVLAGNFIVR